METTALRFNPQNFSDCLAFRASALAEMQRAKQQLKAAEENYQAAVEYQLMQDFMGICE